MAAEVKNMMDIKMNAVMVSASHEFLILRGEFFFFEDGNERSRGRGELFLLAI